MCPNVFHYYNGLNKYKAELLFLIRQNQCVKTTYFKQQEEKLVVLYIISAEISGFEYICTLFKHLSRVSTFQINQDKLDFRASFNAFYEKNLPSNYINL